MLNHLEEFGGFVIAKVQCVKPTVNMSDFIHFMNMSQFTQADITVSEQELHHLALIAKVKTFTFITFYVLAFLVGVIGNGLVVYLIIKVKSLHSITSLFLVSLSTADLLLILICVPIKVIEFLTNHWVFGSFMCKTFHYLHTFTAVCSVMNLTAMSLERYFAILHPLKAKIRTTFRRAKIIIFVIWLISFLSALPILLGKQIVQVGIASIDVCARVWCSQAWKIFELYRTLILLVLPFSIMAFCYVKISMELYSMPVFRRRQKDPSVHVNARKNSELEQSTENVTLVTEVTKSNDEGGNNNNNVVVKPAKEPRVMTGKTLSFRSHSDDEATRRQIIKILMMIVGIFFVCWAPITINNLLTSFEVLPRLNVGVHWYLRIIFHLLAYVNSCVNPIVYGFMSKKFREAFKKVFCSERNVDNMYASIEMNPKQSTSQNRQR